MQDLVDLLITPLTNLDSILLREVGLQLAAGEELVAAVE